jgi:hypothetical protein
MQVTLADTMNMKLNPIFFVPNYNNGLHGKYEIEVLHCPSVITTMVCGISMKTNNISLHCVTTKGIVERPRCRLEGVNRHFKNN